MTALCSRSDPARTSRDVDVVGRADRHRQTPASRRNRSTAVRRRDPGEGRDDHLVAGSDARRASSARCSPVVQLSDRQRMRDPVALREGLLECRDLRALRQPAGRQRLAQRLPLLLAHAGQGDLDASAFSHRMVAHSAAAQPARLDLGDVRCRQSISRLKPSSRSMLRVEADLFLARASASQCGCAPASPGCAAHI